MAALTATVPPAKAEPAEAATKATDSLCGEVDSVTASSTPHASDEQYKESEGAASSPVEKTVEKEEQPALEIGAASTDSLRDVLDYTKEGEERRRHVLETRLRTVRDVLKHQSLMLEQLVAYSAECHRWMVEADHLMRSRSMAASHPPPQLPTAFRAAGIHRQSFGASPPVENAASPTAADGTAQQAKTFKRPAAAPQKTSGAAAAAAGRPTDDPGIVSVTPYQTKQPQAGRHPPPPHHGGPPQHHQMHHFQQMGFHSQPDPRFAMPRNMAAQHQLDASGNFAWANEDPRASGALYDGMYAPAFGVQRGARAPMRGRGGRRGGGGAIPFGNQPQQPPMAQQRPKG